MFNSQPGFRPQPIHQAQQFNSVRGGPMQQYSAQQQRMPQNLQQQMQPQQIQQPPLTAQQHIQPSSGGAAPLYAPQSDAERMYYDQLFDIADANRNGKVSGQEAVKFLMLSGVQPPVLKVS